MSEDTWTNSSITQTSTLSADIRQERLFRKPGISSIQIIVSLNNPSVFDYDIGDRCRLVLSDRWLSYDLPSVRIIDKVVSPQQGSGQVQLTLDLTDLTEPDVDTGGGV